MDSLKQNAHEFIKDRLYLVSVRSPPADTRTRHCFTVEQELEYLPFFADFGPLSLANLYLYCEKLNNILKDPEHAGKKIYHYTSFDIHARANAAYLIASYCVVKRGYSPEEAHRPIANISPPLHPFRDASYGPCTYKLNVIDVLRGVHQAVLLNWIDFSDFDPDEYQFYEKVQNGDFNWVLPDKFIAFAGPHDKHCLRNGYPQLEPEDYFVPFRQRGVTDVIRLNKELYHRDRFTAGGFKHHDLFFIDGSTPSEAIVNKFMAIVENAKGVVAVHCKAGLGRTGSLIALYMMKHYKLTARECIGWLRVARPGSILGPQQYYLEQSQARMWALGDTIGSCRVEPAKPDHLSHGMAVWSSAHLEATPPTRRRQHAGGMMAGAASDRFDDERSDVICDALSRASIASATSVASTASTSSTSPSSAGPAQRDDDDASIDAKMSQGDFLRARKMKGQHRSLSTSSGLTLLSPASLGTDAVETIPSGPTSARMQRGNSLTSPIHVSALTTGHPAPLKGNAIPSQNRKIRS